MSLYLAFNLTLSLGNGLRSNHNGTTQVGEPYDDGYSRFFFPFTPRGISCMEFDYMTTMDLLGYVIASGAL